MAFKPQNDLLIRQGVTKLTHTPTKYTKQSIVECVAAYICLVFRLKLPKDVVVVILQKFVLQHVDTLTVFFISGFYDKYSVRLTVPRKMTCEEFALMTKQRRLEASLALDTFLVHVGNTGIPKLMFMGVRANECIKSEVRAEGWGIFADWTAQKLTQAELNWLNNRTLQEAGVEDFDWIDGRYDCELKNLC